MMKKRIERWLRSPGIFMLALLFINLACLEIGRWNYLDRNTWPSWIQGVGSVEAILVAIWVTWHQASTQRDQTREDVQDELRVLLRSFRTEIEISLEQARRDFGPSIENTVAGHGFFSTVPVPEDPFVIYNALIPKLGLIKYDPLSNQIVRAYTAAKAFVLTVRYNNELLDAMVAAERLTIEPAAAAARKSVDEYGDRVRSSWAAAQLEIDLALHLLNPV